jgi:hypothetical protein
MSPDARRRGVVWAVAIVAILLLSAGTAVGLVIHYAGKNPDADHSPVAAVAPPKDSRSALDPGPPGDDPEMPPPPKGVEVPDAPRPADRDPPVPPPLHREPALPAPSRAQNAWLPPAEQDAVNKAIDRGVALLKERQMDSGAWPGFGNGSFHHVGLSALPGLTLLECGVPPSDEHIQKAASHVRDAIPTLTATYELALSILFLDRLGEERDRPLIRSMALRLVAGQSEAGGWTYQCPIMSTRDEENMLTILRHQQPAAPGDDIYAEKPALSGTTAGDTRGPDKTTQTTEPTSPPPSGSTFPLRPQPRTNPDGSAMPLPARPSADDARRALNDLPKPLRQAPAFHDPSRSEATHRADRSDNSNTQFAILGVWTARRHGVPMERTVARITRRFRDSQAPNGGWHYAYIVPGRGSTPAMTGAGLLGLAVGLGLANPDFAPDQARTPPRNAAVERGLQALAESIGQPLEARRRGRWPNVNLYFLWTVERVGVLYNLRKIGGKDWYAWGAQMLLDSQNDDGSWHTGGYPGSVPTVDTCFALLFLKRANLVQDLTKQLEFVIDTKRLNENR